MIIDKKNERALNSTVSLRTSTALVQLWFHQGDLVVQRISCCEVIICLPRQNI